MGMKSTLLTCRWHPHSRCLENTPRQPQVSIELFRSSVYRIPVCVAVTKGIEGMILLMFEHAEYGDMTLGSAPSTTP